MPEIPVSTLKTKGSLFLTRPDLRDYVYDVKTLRKASAEVFEAFSTGFVSAKPKIFSVRDIKTVHEDLESRRTTGSLILALNDTK